LKYRSFFKEKNNLTIKILWKNCIVIYTKKINFLYRDLIARIKPWIERDEIIVILGARQVGKTSLLLYLKDEIEKKGEKTFL
jgi:predicted AAA+ superfamily ATPase